MESQSPEELSARIESLEKQVADLRALLEMFVSVDESTKNVTIDAESIRCESMTIYEWWIDDEDEYREQDRISLFVSDDDDTRSTLRMQNGSGQIALDVEACGEFVACEFYRDGKMCIEARADADASKVHTLHRDGKTYGTGLASFHESGWHGLRAIRPDRTTALEIGATSKWSKVNILDTTGRRSVISLQNQGDDLGKLWGHQTDERLWLSLQQEENGGFLRMWGLDGQNWSHLSVGERSELSVGQSEEGVAISLLADSSIRTVQVGAFRGDRAVAMGVDGHNRFFTP